MHTSQMDLPSKNDNFFFSFIFFSYEHNGKQKTKFLFLLPLLSDTTAESIFMIIDKYFTHNGLQWRNCYEITTDGCPSMLGKRRGLAALGITFLCFFKNHHFWKFFLRGFFVFWFEFIFCEQIYAEKILNKRFLILFFFIKSLRNKNYFTKKINIKKISLRKFSTKNV